MSDLSYMQAAWFGILTAEVARSSRQQVADALGVSRTTISLIINGKYGGSTEAVAVRVVDKLGVFACLYDGQMISPTVCRSTANVVAPTHNPAKLAAWSACQQCPKNKGGV